MGLEPERQRQCKQAREASCVASTKTVEAPDSCLCNHASLLGQKVPKVYLGKGSRKRKVKKIHTFPFVTGEELDTQPVQEKKNTRPAE